MSYTALYRKFRPIDFKDVKGQDHIVTTLQNQIKSDRIGHAYLFCGTRGTGKTTVAKILAKAVNCEQPVDGNPCGECPTCKAIAAGISMNVIEIDAASNNGVDNIREIRDEVQYSPTEGRYKVYIIDEVHMLSMGAFNALLKTLEEPPSYVIFILATTEAHKIPITILSRCQRYDFHRISIDTIADRMTELMHEENISVEDRAIRYIAKAADGSLRDGLSLLDQCIAFYLGKDLKYENVLEVLGAVDTEIFAQMLNLIMDQNTAGCIRLLDQIVMQGRDLPQFVNDFIWYLRNLLLIQTTDNQTELEDVIEISKDRLEQLKIDAKRIDADSLMRFIRVLSELSSEFKFSSQKRIKLEIALIKLARPAVEQYPDIGEVLSRLAMLEDQMQNTDDKVKQAVAAAQMHAMRSGESRTHQSGQMPPGSDTEIFDMEGMDEEAKPVQQALPQDIIQIAKQWDGIIHSVESPMLKSFLAQAKVTLAEDGRSLAMIFQSVSAYNALSREEQKKEIEQLIEERTGLQVPIIVVRIDDKDDLQNRFTDIRELVNMNIEVDDKEEFI